MSRRSCPNCGGTSADECSCCVCEECSEVIAQTFTSLLTEFDLASYPFPKNIEDVDICEACFMVRFPEQEDQS